MRSSNAFQAVSAELLSRGHSMRFRAEGKSMYPTIREGEAIIVEPVAPHDVKRGDILLCRGGRGVIAHRVVTIKDVRGQGAGVRSFRSSILYPRSSALSPLYFFILRGDASSTCDAPVESGQVLGRVVSVERDGRSINLNTRRSMLLQALRVLISRLKHRVAIRLSAARSDAPRSVTSRVAGWTGAKDIARVKYDVE